MIVELRQWDFEDYHLDERSLAVKQTRLSSVSSVGLMLTLVSANEKKTNKIIDIVKRPQNKLNLMHSRLICFSESVSSNGD